MISLGISLWTTTILGSGWLDSWILAQGNWRDDGFWRDDASWIDGV